MRLEIDRIQKVSLAGYMYWNMNWLPYLLPPLVSDSECLCLPRYIEKSLHTSRAAVQDWARGHDGRRNSVTILNALRRPRHDRRPIVWASICVLFFHERPHEAS
ncbi:hypothetical protein OH76DRAFT_1105287 [Lentinus brumalis]|uniref:Uncharacterized protein n=1 Tax=Lentinus brumalis TaxID=2498619 RepID=A0A371CVH7_9APHY|nr:hypothetical protein OH76DRAFT_1105287 [Polyporus brumalis]